MTLLGVAYAGPVKQKLALRGRNQPRDNRIVGASKARHLELPGNSPREFLSFVESCSQGFSRAD